MIRLSRLADYAIVLTCEMAMSPREIFSARKLHEQTGISQSAIMKILKLLAGAELIESARGANGGYRMRKDPGEVTILDVVQAIDGPVAVTLCSHQSAEPCSFEGTCMAKTGWGMVNHALQDTLSSFTIADFLSAHAAQHHSTATRNHHVFSTQ